MRSPGDPSTWPAPEQQFKAELGALGIPEDTIWELVNSRTDYPEAVPITIDWLEHLDERVPAGDAREAWRKGLARNLISKHARGNQRAFDAVVKLFYGDPPLTRGEMEAAVLALLEIATADQLDQMAALFEHLRGDGWRFLLMGWLAKVATPEAVTLTVQLLSDPDPDARYQAVKALARQRPPGVRHQVLALLDDPDPDVREEAAKTLAKLPD